MSELTDREIHLANESVSLGCPNCRGRLSLSVASGLGREDRLVIIRMLKLGSIGLSPTEDAEDELRKSRDAGKGTLITEALQ